MHHSTGKGNDAYPTVGSTRVNDQEAEAWVSEMQMLDKLEAKLWESHMLMLDELEAEGNHGTASPWGIHMPEHQGSAHD